MFNSTLVRPTFVLYQMTSSVLLKPLGPKFTLPVSSCTLPPFPYIYRVMWVRFKKITKFLTFVATSIKFWLISRTLTTVDCVAMRNPDLRLYTKSSLNRVIIVTTQACFITLNTYILLHPPLPLTPSPHS